MAPISEDLAVSLDTLREQIKEAETYLNSHPHGDDVTVQVDSVDSMHVELGLVICGGKKRLCMEATDPDNKDNNQLAPIVELPVAKRVRCAKSVPKLIEKCDKIRWQHDPSRSELNKQAPCPSAYVRLYRSESR